MKRIIIEITDRVEMKTEGEFTNAEIVGTLTILRDSVIIRSLNGITAGNYKLTKKRQSNHPVRKVSNQLNKQKV